MKAHLDHIGIAVADLGASLAFFRDALGLEVHGVEEVGSQRVRAHFVAAGASSLELLEATAPDSPIAKYLAKRGPGLHHVTLRVDDLGAALALPQDTRRITRSSGSSRATPGRSSPRTSCRPARTSTTRG